MTSVPLFHPNVPFSTKMASPFESSPGKVEIDLGDLDILSNG